MGSPLGPILTNIFMTELKKDIIQKLIDKKFISSTFGMLMTLYMTRDKIMNNNTTITKK